MPTMGVDSKIKRMTIDGKKIKLQVYDTNSQDRYLALTKQYYQQAQGILLLYDANQQQSFDNLQKHLNTACMYANEDTQIKIVGNIRSTQGFDRIIETQQGEDIAITNKASFQELDVSDHSEVQKLFDDFISTLIQDQFSLRNELR